jgi:hypothetical protein
LALHRDLVCDQCFGGPELSVNLTSTVLPVWPVLGDDMCEVFVRHREGSRFQIRGPSILVAPRQFPCSNGLFGGRQ